MQYTRGDMQELAVGGAVKLSAVGSHAHLLKLCGGQCMLLLFVECCYMSVFSLSIPILRMCFFFPLPYFFFSFPSWLLSSSCSSFSRSFLYSCERWWVISLLLLPTEMGVSCGRLVSQCRRGNDRCKYKYIHTITHTDTQVWPPLPYVRDIIIACAWVDPLRHSSPHTRCANTREVRTPPKKVREQGKHPQNKYTRSSW